MLIIHLIFFTINAKRKLGKYANWIKQSQQLYGLQILERYVRLPQHLATFSCSIHNLRNYAN